MADAPTPVAAPAPAPSPAPYGAPVPRAPDISPRQTPDGAAIARSPGARFDTPEWAANRRDAFVALGGDPAAYREGSAIPAIALEAGSNP